jgi:hypothetical protein
MPDVRIENQEQQAQRFTSELCVKLTDSKVNQEFEAVIIPDRQAQYLTTDKILIIALNCNYDRGRVTTVYNNEHHIMGKAMQLLVYLEQHDKLFGLLPSYDIKNIVVTTVSDPSLINATNHWIFDREFAKTTVSQLIRLKALREDLYRTALQTLVNENRR